LREETYQSLPPELEGENIYTFWVGFSLAQNCDYRSKSWCGKRFVPTAGFAYSAADDLVGANPFGRAPRTHQLRITDDALVVAIRMIRSQQNVVCSLDWQKQCQYSGLMVASIRARQTEFSMLLWS
jgi:hypothetical protein